MGLDPAPVNAPFSRKLLLAAVMNRRIVPAALAFAAVAACSTAPGIGPTPIAQRQPQPWGWGHTARAEQALTETFGAKPFKPGEYVWAPGTMPAGATEVVVSLTRQRAYVFRAGKLIAASTISSGSIGHESPVGRFPILGKDRHHKSNRYSAAPMPFMQRLNKWGVALHGGKIPGYPASHGCIRLPMAFAAKLFALTRVGDTVYVEG